MVYAINIAFQFGAVDLRSGAFLPIGPGLSPDVGDGLVQGPGTSLLSLGFDGNLIAIDPFTGLTSVVGPTGLGDCSTPVSPCGPNSANWIGYVDGHYYVTDFANNLYSLDPRTGAAQLIGPTGIPGIMFVPFSENADGSLNVFGASLFGYRGKLYAYFATLAANFGTGTFTPLSPGEIYQIDPATGHATPVAATETTFSVVVNVNGTIYAFNAWTGQLEILDPTTGQTTPVPNVVVAAGVVAGAAPAQPAAPVLH
jgi:outer membrane protein assembly factor BamB